MCVARAQMGDTCELSVQAAAALCGEGEELSYWQLMVRAIMPPGVQLGASILSQACRRCTACALG